MDETPVSSPASIAMRSPQELAAHPATALVPRMPENQLSLLIAGMTEQGFDPGFPLAITPDGKVLDGIARLAAATECHLESVPCRIVEVEDPVDYVYRVALLRRHLTDDQRAVLALRWKEHQSTRTKVRRAQQGGIGKAGAARQAMTPEATEISPTPPKQDTRREAAGLFGVPERKLKALAEITQHAPEMISLIVNGTLKIAAAVKQVRDKLKLEEHRERLERAQLLPQLPTWRRGHFRHALAELPMRSVRLLILYHDDLEQIAQALRVIGPAMLPSSGILTFAPWRLEPEIRALLQEQGFPPQDRLVWQITNAGTPRPGKATGDAVVSILWSPRGDARLGADPPGPLPAVIQGTALAYGPHRQEPSTEILRPLIEAATVEGELVVSPFSAFAAPVVAASSCGRRIVAVALDESSYATERVGLEEAVVVDPELGLRLTEGFDAGSANAAINQVPGGAAATPHVESPEPT